jgi:hypothetical protein
MMNHSRNPYSTLRESIINLGYEWQEKDYFFCHGLLPKIDNTITDMKEYVGVLLCTDGDIDISINKVDYNLTASTLLIAHPLSIVHIIRSKRQYKGILLFVNRLVTCRAGRITAVNSYRRNCLLDKLVKL